jgi:hypothetical protein
VAVREKDILGHRTFLIRDPEHIHPLAEWRKTRKIWRGGTPRPWEENVGKCLSLKKKTSAGKTTLLRHFKYRIKTMFYK